MPSPRSAVVLYAHPYPQRSRTGRALLEAVRDLPHVSVRSLYGLYPDFTIDLETEQAAVLSADILVWQSPLYWYGLPALLHLWIEKVLAIGWAYGDGGTQVVGKRVLWVATTGAPSEAYRPGGVHAFPFEAFVPPIQQTAQFCGMIWEPPLIVHGAARIGDSALKARATEYRERLLALTSPGVRDE